MEMLLNRTGRLAAPTVQIGGDFVTGYDPARLYALLQKHGLVGDGGN